MVLYITATHVFFDACKVSHKPCQFTKLSPVLRIMNWVSEFLSALLNLTSDKDGRSSLNL